MSNTTSPVAHKGSEDVLKALGLTIITGKATKYWLELVSLPAGNNNRVWLLVFLNSLRQRDGVQLIGRNTRARLPPDVSFGAYGYRVNSAT